MVRDKLTPLEADTRRQATDSLRGYSYQMLRTIESWLDLAEGEILVVEGAEDIDTIGNYGASVEQVKDTAASGNITLRTPSILEAIANFYAHTERNKGKALQFRYLTTAKIGREKGSPLGTEEPGLEAWKMVQVAPSTKESKKIAQSIQSFLATSTKLPAGLRAWLVEAGVEDFIAKFVLPMEWVTGSPDWDDLLSTLEAKIIELGEARDVSAVDALGALHCLHTEVWRVATAKGDRILRRGDLLRLIDDVGRADISKKQLAALLQAMTGKSDKSAELAIASDPFAQRPDQLAHNLPRVELMARISNAIATGVAVIHGATGMGKTALALATLDHNVPIAWLDLRDLSISSIRARLDQLVPRIEELSSHCIIVLDDLPSDFDLRPLEQPLTRIRGTLERTGGAIVITSVNPLSSRLNRALRVSKENTIEAIAFDVHDVENYLRSSGCPDDASANWAKVIHATTSGHPQLVDARIDALRRSNFPSMSADEFISEASELKDIRAEARKLVSHRPEGERELLARFSLLLGRTHRDRLIQVAQIEPGISEPGAAVDRLTGPWIESMGNQELRASPLLRNYGLESRGKDWAATMHNGIAWSFLKNRTFFASDVFELATHCLLAGDGGPLIQLLPSVLQADELIWNQIAETSSMLLHIGTDPQTKLPFTNEAELAGFRVLQLRIAIQSRDFKQLKKIVDCTLELFDNPSPDLRSTGTGFFELIFLWQLLQYAEHLSIVEKVEFGVRFVKVTERVSEALRRADFGEEIDRQDADFSELAALIPMSLIASIRDANDLSTLVDTIDELDEADRAIALQSFASNREGVTLALDRVWLGEAAKELPNWHGLVLALERLLEAANELQLVDLSEATATLLIRVIDENLEETDRALSLADEYLTLDSKLFRVLAAKAKVLMRAGHAEDSLPIYDEAVKNYPLGLSWLTEVLRDAALAAGKAGNWALATERLDSALDSLDDAEPISRRIGFMFDLAIALHLSGSTRGAVDILGDATKALIEDNQELPPEPLLSVRQFGSQVIKDISIELQPGGIAEKSEPSLEEIFGSTSGLREIVWGEFQAPGLDLFVLLMFGLDCVMPEEPKIAADLINHLRESDNLLVQIALGDKLTLFAQRTLQMDEAVADALREGQALAEAVALRNSGEDTLFARMTDVEGTREMDESLVVIRLLARIVAMARHGQIQNLPVEWWLSELPSEGMAGVREMVERLKDFIAHQDDAMDRVISGSETWDRHLVAALFAATAGNVSADKLLICHALAARYLRQSKLGELTEFEMSKLVTSAWQERCENPAQLVTPRLTVPAIRSAVDNTPPGWIRVHAVLRAAEAAVSSRTAYSVAKIIRDLAN